MNPTAYLPLEPGDFLGPTRRVAQVRLFQARKHAAAGRAGNYRLLLSGPPGCGKSALLRSLTLTLTGAADDGTPDLLSLQCLGLLKFVNGQDVNVDLVRQWKEESFFVPIGGHGRVVINVEECNAISPAALTAWRTFSDTLRPGTDLLLSTNLPLDQLQPQFQSRCQADTIQPPAPAELAPWLATRWSLPPDVARAIAAETAGDVRAALCEAENWLDQQTALAA